MPRCGAVTGARSCGRAVEPCGGAVRLSAASMWTCGRVAWLCDVAGLRGVMVRRWARGGVVYKNDDIFEIQYGH